MTRRNITSLLVLIYSIAGGCVLAPTQADRLTYESIAPAHASYVRADQTLDDTAKQRRLDLLETWRMRVGAPAQATPPVATPEVSQ